MNQTTQASSEQPETRPSYPKKSQGGLARFLYDLTARRQRFRQFVGVALVFLVTFAGTPTRTGILVGGAIATLGMLVRLWASGYVMKNKVLATVGPYARVRHPLYVGNLLIAVGFCVASGLWWSYPVMLAMVLYFYPHTIRYEDQKLHRLFGEPWERWSAVTRALLPRLRPYSSEASERPEWSLRLSMMKNGEPLHIVIGLACLAYLWGFRV